MNSLDSRSACANSCHGSVALDSPDCATKRLANGTNEARVAALYRATLGREPEPEELRLAKRFVAQSGLSKETLPWQELAQALLLSNEFMFVD